MSDTNEPQGNAHAEPPHVDVDSARAGQTPHRVRYILAISLGLIVVIYACLIWL